MSQILCFIVAIASETLVIARLEVKINSDYNGFFLVLELIIIGTPNLTYLYFSLLNDLINVYSFIVWLCMIFSHVSLCLTLTQNGFNREAGACTLKI
jgi:hypothetical protein